MNKDKNREPKSRSKLYSYLLCALFAALTAIFSQIMIPLPFTPVPINLALLAVWLCGIVLGAKRGAISILVYILLGAIGVPVFHGFMGGIGVLAGPTGGYIVGYLPAVVIFGFLYNRYIGVINYNSNNHDSNKNISYTANYNSNGNKHNKQNHQKPVIRILQTIAIGLPALAACYMVGTVWFVITTGTNVLAALMMCVIPFVPGDIIKLVIAGAVALSLKKHIRAFGTGNV